MLARSVLLSTVLLLGACQGTSPKIVTDPAGQQLALQNLNAFSVTGGLGVWTDEESISTRIEWRQIAEDFDLMIRLPAGLSTVQVARKAGVASVRNGSTQPILGHSAGVLMQQALGLGIAVPIEQMALWIKGLPGDRAQAVEYDKLGRLANMEYIDEQNTRWRAKVLKYTTHENAYVPATILTTGGPYTVRLTLKNWSSLANPPGTSDTVGDAKKSKRRLQVPGR